MIATKLSDKIFWIGANIHTEDLFEGIWPIPNGVSLNSYLLKGDKIAIIELVREWGGAAQVLMQNLKSLSIKMEDIDFVILNHLEPDHTGFTHLLSSIAPKAQILTTQKGVALVDAFYGVKKNVKSVKTGDELDLGNDLKLRFAEIPNVHWPETMATFEVNSGILFSGDAFGAYGVHQGSIFDDETPNANKQYWETEMLRYYANIVASFSPNVVKAINSLSDLDIKMIAPSHGLIWRGKPDVVIKKYQRYAQYNQEFGEPEICVVWGSMYGNTEVMLNEILKGIADQGISMTIHRVPNEDVSFILADAYKSAGLIIGAPTYEYGMFPPMKYFMELLRKKHMRYKKVMYFGSYGWSGGAKREFDELVQNMHWEIMEPVIFNGQPTLDELEKGKAQAAEMAKEIKKIPSKIKNEDY